MALTGTLDDLCFAEIVQVINQGGKTGELIIRRGREEAKVKFSEGEIAQASLRPPAPARKIEGAEAIYRLLGWSEGEFEFNRIQGRLGRFIEQSTDELILEGMKRLDEWEKVQEEITDSNVVLRLRASAVGDKYDELTEQERTILRLVDARRDVTSIIRESGIEPTRALFIISELIGKEMVEEWEPSPQASASSSLKKDDGERRELLVVGTKGHYSPGGRKR
jgi:hypothetical protein